jgi:hypothetical protein
MTTDVADEIVRAGEARGLDISLRLDYSGRGMDGKQTAAVSCGSTAEFLVAACRAVRHSEDPDALLEAMESLRYDALGKGMIFY